MHFVTGEEVEVGSRVEQVVDWERRCSPPLPPSARWDHMQQHSGQHLLSAVLERRQSTNTLSWWMAETSRDKVMVPGCQGGGLLDEGLNLESQL